MTTWGELFPTVPDYVSSATFSPCRKYRYDLRRRWDRGPLMACIGLNPSTASEHDDDPTIRRVAGFAKREGCGGIVMLNLFALRSTDPKALLDGRRVRDDAVGPDNNHAIQAALVDVAVFTGGVVVAAWGNTHARLTTERVRVVRQLIGEWPVMCFGTTKDGAPKHPLRLASDTPLVPWRTS